MTDGDAGKTRESCDVLKLAEATWGLCETCEGFPGIQGTGAMGGKFRCSDVLRSTEKSISNILHSLSTCRPSWGASCRPNLLLRRLYFLAHTYFFLYSFCRVMVYRTACG